MALYKSDTCVAKSLNNPKLLLYLTWLILTALFRLVEETFTVDEVIDMMDGLQTVVHSEVESELINTTYTNVLLLRQLFSQAEKWYLKLQTDVSELENR